MSMTTIDKKMHGFKRRVINRALTSTTAESEELMLRNVRTFCQMLLDQHPKDDWNSAKDMTQLVAYVTSDIMGDLTFSRNWNMLKSEENRYILDLLPQGVRGINMVGLSLDAECHESELIYFLRSQDTCLPSCS
jgi:hypothetical protein